MKKTIYRSCIALSILTLTACAPQKKVHQPVLSNTGSISDISENDLNNDRADNSQSQDSDLYPETAETVINEKYIDERIKVYGNRLNRWKILDAASLEQKISSKESEEMIDCFREMQKVINGYSKVKKNFLDINQNAHVYGSTMQQVQKDDLSFSESQCGQMLSIPSQTGTNFSLSSDTKGLKLIEKKIENYSRQFDFENVLQMWTTVPSAQRSRLSLQAKINHAQALTFLQQNKNSAKAYQNIIHDITANGNPTDIIKLRQKIADLYTASKQYGKAKTQYKLIAQDYARAKDIKEWSNLQVSILDRMNTDTSELNAYAKLLGDYLSFVPATDGYKVVNDADAFLKKYPYTPVASNVGIMKNEAVKTADDWYKNLEKIVQEFKNKNQYEEAIGYLQSIPLSLFDPEKATAITKQIEELLLADAIERETHRMSKMQDLQKQWNNGQLLVNAERYSEAIDVFKTLRDTDYHDKAVARISEITLDSAKSERRKAADLFIRYTKTDDPASQEKLLVESRKILKGIIKDYPNVEIIEKVKRNIDRVELEMNDINPTLLETVQADELADPTETHPIDTFDLPTE
ncbi:MAG: hypothetical protein OCC45_14605 [Desulfotalea sp.]